MLMGCVLAVPVRAHTDFVVWRTGSDLMWKSCPLSSLPPRRLSMCQPFSSPFCGRHYRLAIVAAEINFPRLIRRFNTVQYVLCLWNVTLTSICAKLYKKCRRTNLRQKKVDILVAKGIEKSNELSSATFNSQVQINFEIRTALYLGTKCWYAAYCFGSLWLKFTSLLQFHQILQIRTEFFSEKFRNLLASLSEN